MAVALFYFQTNLYFQETITFRIFGNQRATAAHPHNYHFLIFIVFSAIFIQAIFEK
jgi:hypothetical protein